MTEYVWYDPELDEIFVNYCPESITLFGESLDNCILIGEL